MFLIWHPKIRIALLPHWPDLTPSYCPHLGFSWELKKHVVCEKAVHLVLDPRSPHFNSTQKTPVGAGCTASRWTRPCTWRAKGQPRPVQLWGRTRTHMMTEYRCLPITQDIMSISIHEKQDVFILNSCFALSVLVSLGRSLVPSNLSAAFMTSSPRKMVKEAAWATNFMNGPRMIFPICHETPRKKILTSFRTLCKTHTHIHKHKYRCIPMFSQGHYVYLGNW